MLLSAEERAKIVVETILRLERSCLRAEKALASGALEGVQAAIGEQNALQAELFGHFAAEPALSPANDRTVAKRVAGILAYREDQLRRLSAYRDEIGRRLSLIGKVRNFNRAIGRHVAAPRHFNEAR